MGWGKPRGKNGGGIIWNKHSTVKAQLRKQGIIPSKVKRKPKPLFGIKLKRLKLKT